MLRTLLTAIVLVPLTGVLLLFAVANRQWISVSLDPFAAEDPALSVSLPLFFVVLIALIGGVVIGGIATWLSQRKWRRTARRHQAELRRLLSEAAQIKRAERESGISPPSRSTALTVGYARPPAA